MTHPYGVDYIYIEYWRDNIVQWMDEVGEDLKWQTNTIYNQQKMLRVKIEQEM